MPLYAKFDFSRTGAIADGEVVYGDKGRGVLGAVRIDGYLCPSGTDKSMRSSSRPVTVNGASVYPYTRHYYGILGPKGYNHFQASGYACNDEGTWFGGVCTQGTSTYPNGARLAEIIDGTSNTYLVGESSWDPFSRYRSWLWGYYYSKSDKTALISSRNINEYPINCDLDDMGMNDAPMGSQHPGGCQFGMADGSARFVAETIDTGIYLATASRNGSEAVSGN